MNGEKRLTNEELAAQIIELKRRKKALLLGHYYTYPEAQDVCDYVGDSLGLIREATKAEAELIVFCGVHFMAETAAILCPTRRVLIPSLEAGCSLASSITGADVAVWKALNPEGIVIAYVNTTAEVKAQTDCCCTSANAIKVVEAYRNCKKILFLPDWNLGHYIERKTGIGMEIWQGSCHVHREFTEATIRAKMEQYPEAEVLVHPESAGAWCDAIFNSPRVYIGSTSGMIARTVSSPAKQLIVVTEQGTLYRMRKAAPDKELILITDTAVCEYMKQTSLLSVYQALRDERYEVKVPEELAVRALQPIERMLSIC